MAAAGGAGDAPPHRTEYKVERALWESFETILHAHGRAYVRRLAKTLDVNERELQRAVFGPDSRMKISMIDGGCDVITCQAFVRQGSVIAHCRGAVQTGTGGFCPIHAKQRPTIIPSTGGMIEVSRLTDSPDREPLWVQSDGTVISADGSWRGTYNVETGKLKLFVIAPMVDKTTS